VIGDARRSWWLAGCELMHHEVIAPYRVYHEAIKESIRAVRRVSISEAHCTVRRSFDQQQSNLFAGQNHSKKMMVCVHRHLMAQYACGY
jgi:hypothetical protein